MLHKKGSLNLSIQPKPELVRPGITYINFFFKIGFQNDSYPAFRQYTDSFDGIDVNKKLPVYPEKFFVGQDSLKFIQWIIKIVWFSGIGH